MNTSNTNPTVAVPVAAVNFLNTVISLLGEAMIVMVTDQEIGGYGYLDGAWVHVEWEDDVPQHLMDRVEAATVEVNATIADNPLVGVCTGDGQSLHLFIRTE